MVSAGWAFPRRDFRPHDPERFDILCDVEAGAREAKRGAWAGSFDIPIIQKGEEVSDIACFENSSPEAEEPSSVTDKSWLGSEVLAAPSGGLAGAFFVLLLQAAGTGGIDPF